MADKKPPPEKVDKLIAELAEVTNVPYACVRRRVQVIAQQKLCVHCARCYIIDYLPMRDRCNFDSLYSEAYECLCELYY